MQGYTRHTESLIRFLSVVTLLIAAQVLSSCGEETASLVPVQTPPARATAGQPLPSSVTVRLEGADDTPIADATVNFTVERGGGSVSQQSVTTDVEGRASTDWTLGIVPVDNVLAVSAAGRTRRFTVRAELAEPLTPGEFADLDSFLDGEGIGGSTEDLAFSPDGHLILGVEGGLISVSPDGSIQTVPLSGDPLISPLGIAFDRAGNLWVADAGGPALRKVSADGIVTTHLDASADTPLQSTNDVVVDHRDRVFVSDHCGGAVIGFDPNTDAVFTRHEFDRVTEGGPNGMAFDEQGTTLYVSTENTGIFCGHDDVPPTGPIGGLFRIDASDGRLGERTAIVTDFAQFGDGVTIDVDGNVYVNFIFAQGFDLAKSTTWVLPAGDSELIELLRVDHRVMANLAFAPEAFGNGMLYIAVLAVPPFTDPSTRGLLRFDLGLDGLPLLP